MAPSLFEESLLATPQTGKIWGPKPNLVVKFALFVATGGLMMLGSDRPRRRRHHRLDFALEVHLAANLISLLLGLLLMYVSMVKPPGSTTASSGKLIMMWVTLFMSVVTLLLSSFLLIFANWSFVALD